MVKSLSLAKGHLIVPGKRHVSAFPSWRKTSVFDRAHLLVFASRRVHVALFLLVEPLLVQPLALQAEQPVRLVYELTWCYQGVFLNGSQWGVGFYSSIPASDAIPLSASSVHGQRYRVNGQLLAVTPGGLGSLTIRPEMRGLPREPR